MNQPIEEPVEWRSLFMDFLSSLKVQTKDYGEILLACSLYGAQIRFLDEICAALQSGQRHIVILKARQLGISTISLAIDLFWLAIHPGMQGALITDTAGNLAKFRVIISQLLENLPSHLKIKYNTSNRDMLVFSNGSVLDYIVAGIREKGRGKAVTLGTSRAYNFIHATECSNWGDAAGYSSLMAALSEHNADRLYIFESTARGFNLFHEIWEGAKDDPETQAAIFIGWWAKESYTVDVHSELFRKHWDGSLTDEEQEKHDIVERDYGITIRPEQWAWYRWKSTKMAAEGSMASEYPSHEREAFVATGRGFFPVRKVADDIQGIYDAGIPFNGYVYRFSEQFIDTRVENAASIAEADLKIFETPNEKGVYVIGVDPAYGRDEDNDRSVVQVWRCYADKMIQVAEYATYVPETHNLAWVICHLAGNYRNCMINIELTGPGYAVKQELDHLKLMLSQGLFDRNFVLQPGMRDFFSKARYYLYHRPDTMGAGYAYFWKCLALDTPLVTPEGWTTIGEVRCGDTLFDEKGNPCRVTAVSPVQIRKKCYSILFEGGETIIADEDHLWQVWRKHWDGEKIRKTKNIIPNKTSVRITDALQCQEKELPVHPYILGMWLGDGSSQQGIYFCHEDDAPQMAKNIRECGMEVGELVNEKTKCRQRIIGLTALLKEAGVLRNKHIPNIYLRASYEQRLALLQGLMDTDGESVKGNGRFCSFTSSRKDLAMQFLELATSLGLKVNYCVRNRVLNYGGGQSICRPAYQFWFTSLAGTPMFRFERKCKIKSHSTHRNRQRMRRIISITETKSVPVKCIQVDSPSHLFLAGKSMIATHNSNSESKQIIFNQFRSAYMQGQMDIKSRLLLKEMQIIVQDGVEIKGSGSNHDDRCSATALAVKAWLEWVRQPLINARMTQAESDRRDQEANRPYQGFVRAIYDHYNERMKTRAEIRANREAWDEDGGGDNGEDAGFGADYEPSDSSGEDMYG